MLPNEIQTLRSRLGLSRSVLARFLGVTEMTLIRWEGGEQSAPRGLPLLILQTLQRASERADDATLARLVMDGTTEPGPAVQRLFTLVYPPESSPSQVLPSKRR